MDLMDLMNLIAIAIAIVIGILIIIFFFRMCIDLRAIKNIMNDRMCIDLRAIKNIMIDIQTIYASDPDIVERVKKYQKEHNL